MFQDISDDMEKLWYEQKLKMNKIGTGSKEIALNGKTLRDDIPLINVELNL